MEKRFHGRLGSPCRRLKVRGRYSRQIGRLRRASHRACRSYPRFLLRKSACCKSLSKRSVFAPEWFLDLAPEFYYIFVSRGALKSRDRHETSFPLSVQASCGALWLLIGGHPARERLLLPHPDQVSEPMTPEVPSASSLPENPGRGAGGTLPPNENQPAFQPGGPSFAWL